MEYKFMTSATECKTFQMPFGANLGKPTQYSMFGIGFDKLDNSEDILEEEFNPCIETFQSFTKAPYCYDVDDDEYGKFYFKYMVDVYSEDGVISCCLALVPFPKFLNDKKRAGIADSCCVEEDELTPQDVYDYCGGVTMAYCSVEGNEITKEIIDRIVSTIPAIEGLRGFYLDAPKNRIGYTGWDYLDMLIKGKSDREVLDDCIKRYNI